MKFGYYCPYQLWFIVDKFICDFLNLRDKVLCNKIGQDVRITMMEDLALVPPEYMMELIGHWDPISYRK
jgi:hypothetical protein